MSDDEKAALAWRRFSESIRLDDAPANWRDEIEESFEIFSDEQKSKEFLTSYAPLSTLLYKRAMTLHRLLAYHDKQSGRTNGFLSVRTGPEPLPAEIAKSFSKQDLHLAKQSANFDLLLPRETLAAKAVPKSKDDFLVVFA